MSINNNISWEDVIQALKTVGVDAPADVLASEILGVSLDKLYEIADIDIGEDEWEEPDWDDEDYVPSSTNGDYSPSNPWDAPGCRISDFIGGVYD